MNTQRVAITVPKNILVRIDQMSVANGLSRSKLISKILKEKLAEEQAAYLKQAYDSVFEDNAISEEQRSTARWLEQAGNEGGQEW